jgi:Arc/MetJ-type ribon-helix-helix transcriptional regulator
MNVALSESLGAIVRRRVEEGGYASPEEYIGALVLADGRPEVRWEDLTDAERQEVERINDLLIKSLDSGPPIVADDAYWENLKRKARERGAGRG